MEYRKEIDGLRALAVLPVIFYHAGVEWLSGGFVGVDIFFVISGYLITSIILKELESETFTLIGFYERRARRILPALFLVMLVSIPIALWLLLPHELEAFAESMIAVVFFASNFLFWQESDYFAVDSEFIPLLHTWSLAVEEQFYILFPLLLLLVWRFGVKKLAFLIAGIAIVSMIWAEFFWRVDASGNFYLLPSRVWELMVGAGCGLYLYKRTPHSNLASQVLSLTGLVLVLLSLILLDDAKPFPSVYALVPVMGAALIILFAQSQTWVAQCLSFKGLVGVGLISYSAYLWHQPLFAFARIYWIDGISNGAFITLVFLSLVLAYLSWHFVEKPFRDRQTFTQRQIFFFSLLVGGGLVFVAGTLIFFEGLPQRFA